MDFFEEALQSPAALGFGKSGTVGARERVQRELSLGIEVEQLVCVRSVPTEVADERIVSIRSMVLQCAPRCL